MNLDHRRKPRVAFTTLKQEPALKYQSRLDSIDLDFTEMLEFPTLTRASLLNQQRSSRLVRATRPSTASSIFILVFRRESTQITSRLLFTHCESLVIPTAHLPTLFAFCTRGSRVSAVRRFIRARNGVIDFNNRTFQQRDASLMTDFHHAG